MRRFIGKAGKVAAAVLAVALGAGLWSCESIYDYEGDCDPHWQVKFIWDYNWDFADAFPGKMGVGSVHLYVFDGSTHKLVLEKEEVSGPDGFAADYVMPIDLPAGRYDFVAWCGLADNSSFAGGGTPSVLDYAAEAWRLSADAVEGTAAQRRLAPLYYGRHEGAAEGSFEIYDREGVHTVPVYLMKDTNEFTLLLQQKNNTLNPEDFDIEIRDDNKALRWDNALLPGEEPFSYRPWRTFNGGAEVEEAVPVPGREPNFLVAKLSTSRLVLRDDVQKEPRLVITNKLTGKEVFNIPLLRYLLLPEEHKDLLDAHNKPHQVTDQEYLDRVDRWTMQFYLDDKLSDDGGWYALDLHILGWHVIEWDAKLK